MHADQRFIDVNNGKIYKAPMSETSTEKTAKFEVLHKDKPIRLEVE